MVMPSLAAILTGYWTEFIGIVVLLVMNFTITFVELYDTTNAVSTLMADLAPKGKVGN